MGETRLRREARQRAVELQRATGVAVRRLREDAGLSQAAVARAAGISAEYIRLLESGERDAGSGVLAAVASVLGSELRVRIYPMTGPSIHDRTQAPMEEALLGVIAGCWRPTPEVLVTRPSRGVVDLVLDDTRADILVATEIQGQVRRLEQQVRWHREKEESLPSSALWRMASEGGARALTTSRLLVLRSSRDLRELARTYEATLRAVYPAASRDAVAAFRGEAAWPGAAIVWVRVDSHAVRLLDGPPPGITLGR